jgi:two-component system, NarL family, nitrate/nitrite response regulator NarL
MELAWTDRGRHMPHNVAMQANSGKFAQGALTVTEFGVMQDARALADELCAWAEDGSDLPFAAWWMTVEVAPPDSLGQIEDLVFEARLQKQFDQGQHGRNGARARGHLLVFSVRPGSDLIAAMLTGSAARRENDHDDSAPPSGSAAGSGFVAGGEPAAAPGRGRPSLSARERDVLLAYASGLTLEATARLIGIRLGTAKTYLGRVKEKYHEAGRPARTKLELATRAREDWA